MVLVFKLIQNTYNNPSDWSIDEETYDSHTSVRGCLVPNGIQRNPREGEIFYISTKKKCVLDLQWDWEAQRWRMLITTEQHMDIKKTLEAIRWHGLQRLHFPSANCLARSLVRLTASVLCHGKRVRVTGSFLRRSCAQIMESFSATETKEQWWRGWHSTVTGIGAIIPNYSLILPWKLHQTNLSMIPAHE